MLTNQFFNGNGFRNSQLYNCYNSPPQNNIYPEVIGEGEVTSLMLPNGTVQYFFTPTAKWWAPNTYPPSVNTNSQYTSYGNPIVGAWFIRSISNPVPIPCGPCYPSLDYNFSTPNLGAYNLKFHNDNWTSTTDIHYFYPTLRQYGYSLMQSSKVQSNAAVQVETINTTIHREVVCTKPCRCKDDTKPMSTTSLQGTKSKAKCNCECNEGSNKQNDVYRHGRKNKHNPVNRPTESKSSGSCECECQPATTDKSITTYTDTACGGIHVGGQETQTRTSETRPLQAQTKNCCENTTPILYATRSSCSAGAPPTPRYHEQTELWDPITRLSRRGIQPASEYRQQAEHSCSTCNSDMDLTD